MSRYDKLTSVKPLLNAAGALALALAVAGASGAAQPPPPPVEGTFVPRDVNLASPIYQTSFDSESELRDWVLEGGRRMSVSGGSLVLESRPGSVSSETDADHLVCWLKREIPADFQIGRASWRERV